MNSSDIAHRFFYNRELRGQYARINVHFEDKSSWNPRPTYYSHSTPIAFIADDLAHEGEKVLVLTDYGYSSTTRKHKAELRHACPFDVVYTPDKESVFSAQKDFKEIFYRYENMGIGGLTKKDARDMFMHYINMYDVYNSRVKPLGLDAERNSEHILYLIEFCNGKSRELLMRKQLAAQRTDEEKQVAHQKRIDADKRRMQRFLDGNIIDQLRTALQLTKSDRNYWQHHGDPKDAETSRDAILRTRNMLRGKRDDKGRSFSYIWVDGDRVRTSQSINVPKSEVAALLRLWKRGSDIIGKTIGHFTILEKTDDYVKVGCHVIPVWNLNAMCDYLEVA